MPPFFNPVPLVVFIPLKDDFRQFFIGQYGQGFLKYNALLTRSLRVTLRMFYCPEIDQSQQKGICYGDEPSHFPKSQCARLSG